jgi:hypothetical protein
MNKRKQQIANIVSAIADKHGEEIRKVTMDAEHSIA